MFKKILLTVFLLLFMQSVFAGALEEASKTNKKIFLYMHTPNCSYCAKFNPTYTKLQQKYGKACKFLKIDANTEYGGTIMRKISAFYVPYVVLIDNQKQTMKKITPTCLMNYACTQEAVDEFVVK